MKIVMRFVSLALCVFLTGCSAASSAARSAETPAAANESEAAKESEAAAPAGRAGRAAVSDTGRRNGLRIYPRQRPHDPAAKVPLVLMMCGTEGDPQQDTQDSGWPALALEKNSS